LDAVADGTIPQGEVDDLALIAAVWVDWAATDEERIFANNLEATRAALASAAEGRPRLEELLAIRGEPQNPFFRRA
jgi:5,6,7,8-tetrahydromethanopterin hydro-lyase